jgi:hypothetical protein
MGKKVKKKSKKQLEDELAKVSVDQKRHEEKDRLLKLEQDYLNAHRVRLDEENDAKKRVLEAERLEEEHSVVARMKGERKQNLEYEQSKLDDQISWQKFVSCHTRPDVAYESQITTYMTMVREERIHQMEDAMVKCHESEEIVEDLMERYCRAREDGRAAQQDLCMHYIHSIRDLEIEQIDVATTHLLQTIEQREQTNNSQVLMWWKTDSENVKLGFWGHLQSKGFRAKQIEFPSAGARPVHIGLDLPKSIAMQSLGHNIGHSIGVRALYTTYDSVQGKDPSQMSVGGMIRVDLLSIPPFSKKVKTWTIRQIPPAGQELIKLPYPNTEHTITSTAITVQPCKIEYKVPGHVLVAQSPTVSWWDAQAEKWSTEGITEIVWDTDARKVSFFSVRLAAFSITQERHLDFPYKFWSMRPVAPLTVELEVQAARYHLKFVITEDGLRLKGPNLPELHDVMYTEEVEDVNDRDNSTRRPRVRSPATLLKELQDCGLNLLPEDSDAKFLDGYTPKLVETQARAYSDLSEIAAFYDIASSKHNKSLPAERALVRIRENTLYEQFDPLDPDCDSDYTGILFFPDKVSFVRSLEGVSPCEEALKPGHHPRDGHVTHSSLYLGFDKHPAPAANHSEMLHQLEVTVHNVRFVEAVRQTMQLMRLLSFV